MKEDDSLLEILQSLGVSNDNFLETNSDQIKGSFSSDLKFNLHEKVLFKTKIKVLEICLGFLLHHYLPTKQTCKDLQRDFNNFARKMRCNCHFRNESQYEISMHKVKSTWNPPKGSPALELFLSKVKEDIFSVLPGILRNLI